MEKEKTLREILSEKLQLFIQEHENEDEKKLFFKHKIISGVPTAFIANQIAGRRKAKSKLPTWYNTQNIVYPPSINIEQCSSETTAAYKVEILQQSLTSGFNKVADLTGGFGIDSFFLCFLSKEVDSVEPDKNLFEIAKHNHTILQNSNLLLPASSIQHHNTTAEKFLEAANGNYGLVYLDPSRRTKGNQKIFRLADCVPDITELQDIIFEKADVLLVKASPMLDLKQGIKELKYVAKVFVVAVDNECKEVLFLCRKGHESEPIIEAVDLKASSAGSAFSFLLSEERNSVAEFSNPLRYLYEPHAALLKAGAFKLIAQRFSLKKLQQHTHLYTSENLTTNFPGRVFEIEALIKPNAKVVKQYFPDGKANVATRNYPLSPEELKKKTGLKDGGEKFLIGFSGLKEKFVAVCNKITK